MFLCLSFTQSFWICIFKLMNLILLLVILISSNIGEHTSLWIKMGTIQWHYILKRDHLRSLIQYFFFFFNPIISIVSIIPIFIWIRIGFFFLFHNILLIGDLKIIYRKWAFYIRNSRTLYYSFSSVLRYTKKI